MKRKLNNRKWLLLLCSLLVIKNAFLAKVFAYVELRNQYSFEIERYFKILNKEYILLPVNIYDKESYNVSDFLKSKKRQHLFVSSYLIYDDFKSENIKKYEKHGSFDYKYNHPYDVKDFKAGYSYVFDFGKKPLSGNQCGRQRAKPLCSTGRILTIFPAFRQKIPVQRYRGQEHEFLTILKHTPKREYHTLKHLAVAFADTLPTGFWEESYCLTQTKKATPQHHTKHAKEIDFQRCLYSNHFAHGFAPKREVGCKPFGKMLPMDCEKIPLADCATLWQCCPQQWSNLAHLL